MNFRVDRILLTICVFIVAGLYGCGQQALVETKGAACVAESTAEEVVIEAPQAEVSYDSWHGLGPFYNITFETVIGPENGPDLTKEYEQDTPFKYKWRLHPEWKDGESLDLRLLPNSSMYFYRIANASQATTAEFTVGTGDGLQVWVNGDEVFKRFEVGNANTEKIKARLNQGQNTILLKIFNENSPSELFFEP
ncbi:MAG: hypothetical protein ACYTFK_12800 [Planctomycetota bacterium]|jgi:hypothetical protein